MLKRVLFGLCVLGLFSMPALAEDTAALEFSEGKSIEPAAGAEKAKYPEEPAKVAAIEAAKVALLENLVNYKKKIEDAETACQAKRNANAAAALAILGVQLEELKDKSVTKKLKGGKDEVRRGKAYLLDSATFCTTKAKEACEDEKKNETGLEFADLYRAYELDFENDQGVCNAKFAFIANDMKQEYAGLMGTGGAMNSALKSMLAVGGAVGGYMLLDKLGVFGGDDKEKKEKRDEDEDYKNGVIMVNGKPVECFSESNYRSMECQATLKRLCQSPEKQTSGGCVQFNNHFCAAGGSGVDSMYCLYSETHSYCAQTGEYIADSPACKWKSSRPAECATDSEGLKCRVAMTTDQLTAACKNFPYDPVCKVSGSKTVTQPDAEVAQGEEEEASTEESASEGGGYIGIASSRRSVEGSASSSSMGLASTNMWQNNSQAMQKMCVEGRLTSCPY